MGLTEVLGANSVPDLSVGIHENTEKRDVESEVSIPTDISGTESNGRSAFDLNRDATWAAADKRFKAGWK